MSSILTTGGRKAPWAPSLVRVRLPIYLLCGGFLLLAGQVLRLSVLEDPRLDAALAAQVGSTVQLHGRRGAILDRSGVDLAVSVPVVSVFLDPGMVKDLDSEAKLIANATDLPEKQVRKALSRSGRFVWLKRATPSRQVKALRELGLGSVGYLDETERRYPNGRLSAQVLGFVGRDGTGLEGLERAQEGWLRGQELRVRALRDGRRRTLSRGGLLTQRETDGGDIVLTLDRSIQHATEAALERGRSEHKAKGANAVVLDLRDGSILAMGTSPGFDPNAFGGVAAARFRNRTVTDAFEPGSTVKPLVLGAALEAGVTDPGQRIFCENGSYAIGKHVIHDHHPYDTLTPPEIIVHSSNIGIAKLAEKLGPEAVLRVFQSVGFGRSTGSGLPGEREGTLNEDPRSWKRIELANRAFGQGLTVTTLQLAQSMALLAGEGQAFQPHIVLERRSQEGQLQRVEPQPLQASFGAEAAAIVRAALVRVASPEGTAARARIPGYTVAGKTGTSQKVEPGTGRYGKDLWTASFVGYAPAEDPRVVIAVVVDEPTEEHTGGAVAAPIFAEIARATLRALDVPSNELVDSTGSEPDESATYAVVEAGPDAAVEAEAVGVEGEPDLSLHPADFVAEPGAVTVPDLAGWSLRDAVAGATRVGLRVRVVGDGNLQGQNPPAGSRLEPGDLLELALGGSPSSGS